MKPAVRVALGLVSILVLVCAGGLLFLDSIAVGAVERGGSHALGVETRLDDASIGLLSGEFVLNGLSIANPPGFGQPSFFSMQDARLDLPLSALADDPVTIPSLVLEGITLDLERNATGTNYGVILDNLTRFESGQPETGKSSPGAEGGKAFLLRRLVLKETRATVDLFPAGGELTKLSLSIPEIVVEDLGSKMTVAQVCALVVRTVVRAAIDAGSGVVPEDLLQDLRQRTRALEDVARTRIAEQLGEVEGELQQQARKLGPEAEKALQEASDKLGGLLNKDKKKK